MTQHSRAYPDQYIQVLKERVVAVYQEVIERQQGVVRRGQGEEANKIDKVEVGDKVHVFSAREAGQPATKLRPHWAGPYLVLKKIPPAYMKCVPAGGGP